ncbi:hypothetical protein [Lignipirellula cremea]|uniref:TraB family protein n=1 Tax=Lignipirellula cremea TaxID=2528010 RepID=A0A518DPK8_9BACT|nr:hypothetical protein [Lignipirellula cremea]QDU93775.1 hypothetical protein Pla8534_15580 [Lignipirellula cremea]
MSQARLTPLVAKSVANSLLCLSAFAWGATAAAQQNQVEDQANQQVEAAPAPKFLRVVRNDRGVPQALETAIARYQSPDGVIVDLVGVVHIADKDYYAKLNDVFAGYDSVLYELVAPPNKRPEPGRRGGGAVSGVQTGMTGMLDLAFQLDHIDYKKPNFVHADMSPEEFSQSMNDRGESVWQMVFRSIGYSAARQGTDGPGEIGMLQALFSSNRAVLMKRQMATQFEDLEGGMAALEGPDGSTLITERNRKAFEVLETEIQSGKKKLAVFYGAGHLIDMDRRLRDDFKMKPLEMRWLRAWKID